jgi:hypothetical protein
MIRDPKYGAAGGDDQAGAEDLFDKLDSLIQKHQGRTARRPTDGAPVLTEPVDETPAVPGPDIPLLEDAVDPGIVADDPVPGLIAEKRRQLQVALYLRLRQRLDRELDAALADDRRLGAVALHPAFTRVADELRAVLPIVVRESVEQVFGLDSLEALFGRPAGRTPKDPEA